MKPQIAFFGGSFNPPHVAHQMVCLLVLQTCAVDGLWMVPTYRHPFAKDLVDFEHRCTMAELAAEIFGGRVVVSRIEAELARPSSRTLETLEVLRERHPDIQFRLVVGADILTETAKWHRWSDVVALAPPIVIGRAGYDQDVVDAGGERDVSWTYLEVELPRVSSTEVRKRLSSGQDVHSLVPRVVLN